MNKPKKRKSKGSEIVRAFKTRMDKAETAIIRLVIELRTKLEEIDTIQALTVKYVLGETLEEDELKALHVYLNGPPAADAGPGPDVPT